MKKVFWLLFILSLSIAITGCNKDIDENISIKGEIKEIYTDEETLAIIGILVEGEVEEDTMYDSANVTINDDTKVYKEEEEATLEELEEGTIVKIVFDGPVAESYPVQGTAQKIIILED